MNTENKSSTNAETPKIKHSIDGGRRSFAKIGAAAPILLSLASKTAWGRSDTCTTSGQLSGNLSAHHRIQTCVNGQPYGGSPGYWANAGLSSWTGLQGNNFNTIFACSANSGVAIKNSDNTYNNAPTLLQAFQATGLAGMNANGGTLVYYSKNSSNAYSYTTDSGLVQLVFQGVAAYLNSVMPDMAFPFSTNYVITGFCAKNLGDIPDFQQSSVIDGGHDAVLAWLINHGYYINGVVTAP